MKIKICGLKRVEDVDYVNQYHPELAGFIFAGKKRKIDYDTAVRLKERLDSSIMAVGVFVNEDVDYIAELVFGHIIDIVQLHGDEDEDYIQRLRQVLGQKGTIFSEIPLIKAVRVQNTGQVLAAEKLPVDYLLLDAFQPGEYGGSGKTFDYKLIPHLSKPYLLAGGIDSDNVIKIIANLRNRNIPLPFCVDVSSSVETDGCKDQEKISEIVSVVHSL